MPSNCQTRGIHGNLVPPYRCELNCRPTRLTSVGPSLPEFRVRLTMERVYFAISALVVLVAPQFAWAQGGTRAPGAVTYQSHPLAQAIYWLTSDQIQKELEMVPDQKEKLDKLRNDLQTKLSDAAKSFDFKELQR